VAPAPNEALERSGDSRLERSILGLRSALVCRLLGLRLEQQDRQAGDNRLAVGDLVVWNERRPRVRGQRRRGSTAVMPLRLYPLLPH
jgi:hypothetical protein